MDSFLTLTEIIKATRAQIAQRSEIKKIKGISIDSRTIKKGELFVAIEGHSLDGHKYVPQAIKNGAGVVIVSEISLRQRFPKDIFILRVKDTTKALGQIASLYRREFNIPIIAITGSAGKTTTKEMVASVLSQKYKVLKNEKSENNQWGVPLTLLKLKGVHEVAVLEVGTNQFGDIRWLSKIIEPDVVIFTNIGPCHLEGLKTLGRVFREKLDLIRFMKPRGLIVYNADDQYLKKIQLLSMSQKKVSYGCCQTAKIRAQNVHLINNRFFEFQVNRKSLRINTLGKHNVSNALAAISCGLSFNISYNRIIRGLSRLRNKNSRLGITRKAGVCIINDTYNANPLSVRSAIEVLDGLKVSGRKFFVCADMLELGAQKEKIHRQIASEIARTSIDNFISFGPMAQKMSMVIKKSESRIDCFHAGSITELNGRLKKIIKPGDAVLVKGSRAMKMERVVGFLNDWLSG